MNFFDLLNATADEIVILDAVVDTRCPFCGKRHSIEVNEADYFDWQDGKLAQDAFPYLSAGDREMLISGICPKCFEEMFSTFDDAEEAFGEDVTNEDVGEILSDIPLDDKDESFDNDALAQMAINVMKAILNGEVE